MLSPTTEAKDRGPKWVAYQTISTLTDYVLISTTERRIEHYQRASEGWVMKTREAGQIALSHDLVLILADVYDATDIDG